jgi:hypothetical protein
MENCLNRVVVAYDRRDYDAALAAAVHIFNLEVLGYSPIVRPIEPKHPNECFFQLYGCQTAYFLGFIPGPAELIGFHDAGSSVVAHYNLQDSSEILRELPGALGSRVGDCLLQKTPFPTQVVYVAPTTRILIGADQKESITNQVLKSYRTQGVSWGRIQELPGLAHCQEVLTEIEAGRTKITSKYDDTFDLLNRCQDPAMAFLQLLTQGDRKVHASREGELSVGIPNLLEYPLPRFLFTPPNSGRCMEATMVRAPAHLARCFLRVLRDINPEDCVITYQDGPTFDFQFMPPENVTPEYIEEFVKTLGAQYKNGFGTFSWGSIFHLKKIGYLVGLPSDGQDPRMCPLYGINDGTGAIPSTTGPFPSSYEMQPLFEPWVSACHSEALAAKHVLEKANPEKKYTICQLSPSVDQASAARLSSV